MRSIEDFVIVWLGKADNYDNTMKNLRCYVHDIHQFVDTNECINFIIEFNSDQKIIFILNIDGTMDYETILSTIEPFSFISMIYILKKDASEVPLERGKIQWISSENESWMNHLRRTTLRGLNNELVSFQTLSVSSNRRSAQPAEKLNKQEAFFMYAQMVKETLLAFDLTSTSKTEMIDYCRRLYSDNQSELDFIKELESNPRSQSSVYFYTAEHFLYRILNRALRLQEIDKLYYLRYFIRQLNEELKQLYNQQVQERENRKILYRGQGMSQEEFGKIQNSTGGLLSFNTFLSTSADFAVAYMYAETILSATDMVPVFMEIDVQETNVGDNVFADVGNLTHFTEESEYLFSMGSIFRISSIDQERNGIYRVKLILTGDQDEELAYLKLFMSTTIQQTYHRGPLFRLAGLMNEMSQSTYAEYFYTLLLNDETIQRQPCALAVVHGNMGCMSMGKGDTLEALKHYELALKLYDVNPSPDNDQSIAIVLANIGQIYISQGKFKEAISNYERALQIDMNPPNGKKPNPEYVSNRYNQLGVIYERMGDYEKALQYYQSCLQMRLDNMPPNHPDLFAPYNNIALLYDKLGQSQEAANIYMRLIEISTNSLPPGHLRFATLYYNLAFNFEDMGQFNEALSYARKAYDIVRKSSLPPTNDFYVQNRQHLEHLEYIVLELNQHH